MASELKSPESDGPTPAEWRAAMGYFPTGVTVVTTWDHGLPVGSTINAFCSVSLAPPMLLFCLDLANPLLDPVEKVRVFGINILGEESGHARAMHFAKAPEERKLAGFDCLSAPGGAPQLADSPVFVDCVLENSYRAGDHMIMVGRGIRAIHAPACEPLLYHRGRFPKFTPVT